MNPDYGTKHIAELPLNNDVQDTDVLPFDQSSSGNAYKIQLGGLIAYLAKTFPRIDFSNVKAEELVALIAKLGTPNNPDDGVGLVLRTHANETQTGLRNLSQKLIDATAHILTDKYFSTLTADEIATVCGILAGTIVRDKTGTADGLLANRDLSNLTGLGLINATRVPIVQLEQTSDAIEIPSTMLGKMIQISLTQDVGTITLPTSGLDTTMVQQCLIVIRRNGFNIDSNAFVANGYTLRGTGPAMPSFSASFTKDNAIEFFCEYDSFTDPSNPTWNYGYSKIGH